MNVIPVIAIFDVGKTNKKLFLFDEHYKIVFEKSARLTETMDEDGFPCENLEILRLFIFDSIKEVLSLEEFELKAVNFSAYGASFIYLDKSGKPLTPLYSYLKPYPPVLSERFYESSGGKENFSLETASPVLQSLNSGLQLYRFKYEKPGEFEELHFALHLPQYLSFLLTGKYYSDITSIGCHTGLWNFEKHSYHVWLSNEGLIDYLAPIEKSEKTFPFIVSENKIHVGIGLHDSSAALIPYLVNFSDPFVLISTGTWCISMNPFNKRSLTSEELKNDCLFYMQYQGEPVKSSRLHSGLEHEQQVKRIAEYFNLDIIKFREIGFDQEIVNTLKFSRSLASYPVDGYTFRTMELSEFKTGSEAYHHLVADLVQAQFLSTQMVIDGSPVKRIFVDGGFSNNAVFMQFLALAFPELEIFAAFMPQATALGAALAIHKIWNDRPIANNMIGLKYYSSNQNVQI